MWPKYHQLPFPKPRAKLNTRNSFHNLKESNMTGAQENFKVIPMINHPYLGIWGVLICPIKKNKIKSILIVISTRKWLSLLSLKWLSYSHKNSSPHCTGSNQETTSLFDNSNQFDNEIDQTYNTNYNYEPEKQLQMKK